MNKTCVDMSMTCRFMYWALGSSRSHRCVWLNWCGTDQGCQAVLPGQFLTRSGSEYISSLAVWLTLGVLMCVCNSPFLSFASICTSVLPCSISQSHVVSLN